MPALEEERWRSPEFFLEESTDVQFCLDIYILKAQGLQSQTCRRARQFLAWSASLQAVEIECSHNISLDQQGACLQIIQTGKQFSK